MSIEKKIEDLIAAIEMNTKAHLAAAPLPTAPTVSPEAAAPKPAKVKASQKSEEELAAAAKARVAATEAKAAAPTQTVASVIEAMLKANKRKEAIALLGEFGAKSASGISEENADAFIEKANGILLAA